MLVFLLKIFSASFKNNKGTITVTETDEHQIFTIQSDSLLSDMEEKKVSTDTIETVELDFTITEKKFYVLRNPLFVSNFGESRLEIQLDSKDKIKQFLDFFEFKIKYKNADYHVIEVEKVKGVMKIINITYYNSVE